MPEDRDRIIDQIDSANFNDFIRIAFSYGLYYDDADKITISSNPAVLNRCKKELKEKGLNEEYKIEMETKDFLNRSGISVAAANTGWVNICYQGVSVICIVATKHIEANEQLGISYGLNYWNHKKKIPKYFFQTGYVIPSHHYLPELNSILVKYKVSTETELPTKELALRRAVYLNNVDDVQFLLEYGTDVNDISPTGKTALSQVGANTGLSKTKANIGIMDLIRKTLQARGAASSPIGEQLAVHGFSHKNTGNKNPNGKIQTLSIRK